MADRGAKSLIPLFQPRHVAVVGASRTPGKHGHTTVRNLARCGFAGQVWPINPAGEDIEGLRCYRSLADVPEAPDCVFLAIPASAVVETVREAAAIGAKAMVIGASGFAESGTDEGKARQAEITRIAREHGIRMLGPNTNGLLNNDDHVPLGYNTSHAEQHKATGLSIASHSGAILNSVARRLARAGSGFSKWVSVGNEADTDMLDVFEYFIADPATQVIGLIIEAVRDGDRFQDLAQQALAAGKPVVALKLGRSSAGAGAAMAHSSRLAGSARSYEAMFRANGIASVRTLEAFTGGCSLLGRRAALAHGDDGIICIATSGGGGGIVVDMAAEFGLPLAGSVDGDFGAPVNEGIQALGGIGDLRNPVDLSLLGNTWTPLVDVFGVMKACGKVGPVVAFSHVASRPQQDERLANGLLRRKQDVAAPVIVVSPGGLLDPIEKLYADNGIPVFHDLVTAMESLRCWYTAKAAKASASDITRATGMGDVLRRFAERADQTVLSEFDSAAILAKAGVPMVDSRQVTSAAAAQQAASELGHPVILKAMLPGVAHKSKLGLVALRLGDTEAVAQAYRTLQQRAGTLGHSPKDLPCLVQPMLPADYELIVGLSREPGLGHFLVVGLGGIYSEILDDVLLFPVRIGREQLRAELAASKIGRIATQATGEKGGDVVGQLVDILSGLQGLARGAGELIESVDINPILVRGGRCTAVDALVVLRSAAADTAARTLAEHA